MAEQIRLNDAERDILDSLPLHEVMSKNGFNGKRSKNSYYYNCPMPGHNDVNASFHVSTMPDDNGRYSFHCFGCNTSGHGALQLQAKLFGVELRGKDFWMVVQFLAEQFDIPVAGLTRERIHTRSVEPVTEFKYEVCEWTDDHLRALGCNCFTLKNGNVVNPWSMVGDINHQHQEPFDPKDIERVFSLYPISEFTVPCKEGDTKSWSVSSKDFYQMFVIKTVDEKGKWRIKKYEPYAKPDAKGRSFKWTWWYADNVNRDSEYSHTLYGDNDVMDALFGGTVPTDTSAFGNHPVVENRYYDDDNVLQTRTQFKRVVLCSGPRDAMQVYYHSDAHVVYPHSETSDIDYRLMYRLMNIASELYILYDADTTGVRCSRELNLQHLYMRNIELPEDLCLFRSVRSGHPCKDVSDYFERYGTMLKDKAGWGRRSINAHFETLMNSARPLKFWERKPHQNSVEKTLGKIRYDYKIVPDNMIRFLEYSGMWRSNLDGVDRFVRIRSNRFRFIPEDNVVVMARQMMKEWLDVHPEFNDDALRSQISTAKNYICKDVLRELRVIKLNVMPCDRHHDYIFMADMAVRVDAESIESMRYETLDFHVNEDAILPDIWRPMPKCFDVAENVELEHEEQIHNETLDRIRIDGGSQREVNDENARWSDYVTIWSYKLRVLRESMNDMPHVFQFIYDTCRVYYAKEEEAKRRGLPRDKWLSKEERQMQDAICVSKLIGIGYMLSRHRTPDQSYICQLSDYSVESELKAQGRTGKSILSKLLGCVRKYYNIDGKTFKTTPEMMPRNFAGYDPYLHSFININDLSKNVDAEQLYTMAEGQIVKKNLHKDEVNISRERAGKIMISSNRPFDLSADSTRGRVWMMPFSGYYHIGGRNGMIERTPRTKFGYTLGEEETPEQRAEMISFFIQCLQLYLRYQRYVQAPMGHSGRLRLLYANKDIKDKEFIEWAKKFFSDELFFGIPIAKSDLVVSYFQMKGWEVSKSKIDAYVQGSTFGKMLAACCQGMDISVNPDVVYVRDSDRGRLPRCAAYTYEFNELTGNLTNRRVKKKQTSCYYFYKKGEEPQLTDNIPLEQISDPGVEGYIIE